MAGPAHGVISVLATAAGTGAVLLRVAAVVAVAMGLFLLAFMGYFVVPFVFLLLALGIFGLTGSIRRYASSTARRRR